MKTRSSVLLRPAAFMKLMFCCHQARTEIGGFGISSKADPLVIDEFVLILQNTSVMTVEFDDHALADHVEDFADKGIGPDRSFRVWIHTHPGRSAAPSSVDEETFDRCFGRCDWAAMMIQGREEENYCRIRFNIGPGGQVIVPIKFDWASLPAWLIENAERMPQLISTWHTELTTLVREIPERVYAPLDSRPFDGSRRSRRRNRRRREAEEAAFPLDLNEMNELAARSEFMDDDDYEAELAQLNEDTQAWYNSLDRATQEDFFNREREIVANANNNNDPRSCDSST